MQLRSIFTLESLHKYPEIVNSMNLQFSIQVSYLYYSPYIESLAVEYPAFIEAETIITHRL